MKTLGTNVLVKVTDNSYSIRLTTDGKMSQYGPDLTGMGVFRVVDYVGEIHYDMQPIVIEHTVTGIRAAVPYKFLAIVPKYFINHNSISGLNQDDMCRLVNHLKDIPHFQPLVSEIREYLRRQT